MDIPTFEEISKTKFFKKRLDLAKLVAGFVYTKDKRQATAQDHQQDISHFKREAAFCTYYLSKLSFFSQQRDAGIYYCILAKEISSDMGKTHAEFLGYSSLSHFYKFKQSEAKEAITKAREIAGHLKDISKGIEYSAGVVNAGFGSWKKAKNAFKSCIESCKTLGDFKTKIEAEIDLSFVNYLKGDLKSALQYINSANENAISVGDDTQSATLTFSGLISYLSGDFQKTIDRLTEALIAKREDKVSIYSFHLMSSILLLNL